MMFSKEDIYATLKDVWGYDSFRDGQYEIISSALEGRDTLGILPTGGGKSLTFQIPALMKDGLALVVTPLIALMKDQVRNLEARGIRALAIHTGMTRREVDTALNNAAYGDFKFLYISPERINTELFQSWLQLLNVNYIVVDEAHCICQWGYDFRPDYLRIKVLRQLVDAPVIALTATATPEVAADIMDKLEFGAPNMIRTSFERPNLSYSCVDTIDKRGEILRRCLSTPGTGIVYVRSRKLTEELGAFLCAAGVSASHYHAGLSPAERSRRQQDWIDGRVRVMVCTNAFGMGIDKPDVRFVLHYGLPDSIEAYYQEAGRAGRDGKPSDAVLLWNKDDCARLRRFCSTEYPDLEYMEGIYHKMHAFYGIGYETGMGRQLKLDIAAFCRQYSLNAMQAFSAIKYLERCGHWTLLEDVEVPTRVMIAVDSSELYDTLLPDEGCSRLLDAMMRRCEGIFSYPVSIDEEGLAARCGMSVSTLRQSLYNMSVTHVIRYIPGTTSDLLLLHANRLYPKNVNLRPDLYNMLKGSSLRRTESVVEYAREDSQCRSLALLKYFGQEDAAACGHCDVCKAVPDGARMRRAAVEDGTGEPYEI